MKITPENLATILNKHESEISNTIDLMIKYCRLLEREEVGKGCDELNLLFQQGVIKLDLYIQMEEAVKNPETPYEIKAI